jgi:hypothetical protein
MQTEVEQKRLVSVPLHAPELVRPTAIVHRRKKRFTRAGREFLALVKADHVPDPAETRVAAAARTKKQPRPADKNSHVYIH